MSQTKKQSGYSEVSKRIPVIAEADVVVLGGGAAGMTAAAAAARKGAKTLLVEKYGFLGGTFSAALVCAFCGLHIVKEGMPVQVVHGIVDEVLDRLDFYGGLSKARVVMETRASQAFDVAALKIVADEIVFGSGAEVLFHTLAVGVTMDLDSITGLIVENKSGRGLIRSKIFIDCSGDGDLAYFADLPMLVQADNAIPQYPTMMFRVHHVNDELANKEGGFVLKELLEEANQSGKWNFPRTHGIVYPQHHQGEWRINLTQIQREDGSVPDLTNADELSRAEREGRKQISSIFQFLRKYVPGFENCYLIELPAQVGVRQSRNFEGYYVLTAEDVIEGRELPYSIGINTWPLEKHSKGKIDWTLLKKGYCSLPVDSLIPRKTNNLYIAGRCGSFNTDALASVRVSGPCMSMGQAVGTASGLGVLPKDLLDEVNFKKLRKQLEKDGVSLS